MRAGPTTSAHQVANSASRQSRHGTVTHGRRKKMPRHASADDTAGRRRSVCALIRGQQRDGNIQIKTGIAVDRVEGRGYDHDLLFMRRGGGWHRAAVTAQEADYE
jgi:hypothetical protein